MAQQTAVDWLHEVIINHLSHDQQMQVEGLFQQAKHMEMEKTIMDYNAGYDDAQCNHINDAENYANERKYLNDKEV